MKKLFSLQAISLALGMILISSCAKDEKPIIISEAGNIKPVLGYNQPQAAQFGVGLRAAAEGNRLTISVDNRSADPIIIGPKSFRLISQGELVPFEYGKADISMFPITTLNSGSHEFFLVTMTGVETLLGTSVVLNYPPKEILLRVPVEQASANFEFDDSERAFEYRDKKLLSD